MANIEITIAKLMSEDKRNRKRVKGSVRSKGSEGYKKYLKIWKDKNRKRKTQYKERGEIKGRFEESSNKDKQILKVIEKIKQMQREREITAFTEKFLQDMLRGYTNLTDRAIRKKIVELLKYAYKKEGIVTKKFLINTKHYEKKLEGELTKTPVCSIERIWIEKNKIQNFYSFI